MEPQKEKLLSLEMSDYIIDESSSLGRGAFGRVVSGRFLNQFVAVKFISSTEATLSESQLRSLQNEVLLMTDCNHPCILRLYGYHQVDDRTWNFILELCPFGSLWSYLTDSARFPSIPLNLSLAWMSDINSALCYLHRHGIIHCDMKAQNVLFDEGRRCKLTGFGSSMRSNIRTLVHSQPQSSAFTAPEVRAGGTPSNGADMYSFAVTCYQILFRSSPPEPETVRNICEQASTLNLPVRELMTYCLRELPEDRISARDSLEFIGRRLSFEDPRTGSLATSLAPTKTFIGSVSLGSYPDSPVKEIQMNLTFPVPFNSIPKVVLGLSVLDSDKIGDTSIRLSVKAITTHGFTLIAVSRRESVTWQVSATWIATVSEETASGHIEAGSWRDGEVKVFRQHVQFPETLSQVPEIWYSLSGLDCDCKKNTRVMVKAENVTRSSFTIFVQSWHDSVTKCVTIDWLASADPMLRVGVRPLGCWPNDPITASCPRTEAIGLSSLDHIFPLTALAGLDVEYKWNTRIRTHGEIFGRNCQVTASTWGNTVVWAVRVAYVFVLR